MAESGRNHGNEDDDDDNNNNGSHSAGAVHGYKHPYHLHHHHRHQQQDKEECGGHGSTLPTTMSDDPWAAAEYRRRRRCSFPLLRATRTRGATVPKTAGGVSDVSLPDDVFVDVTNTGTVKHAKVNAKVNAKDRQTVGHGEHVTVLRYPSQKGGAYSSMSSDTVDKIRRLLSSHDSSGEEDDEEDDEDDDSNNNNDLLTLNVHHVFRQMDMLCRFENGDLAWKEIARWIKYEEKLDSGNHWSKPHVSTLPLHAILTLRNAVAENSCIIELSVPTSGRGEGNETGGGGDDDDDEEEEETVRRVAEYMVDSIKNAKLISDEDSRTLLSVLLCPHKHKHRELKRKHRSKGGTTAVAPSGEYTAVSASPAVTPPAGSNPDVSPPCGSQGTGDCPTPSLIPKSPSHARLLHKRPGMHVVEALQSFPRGASSHELDEYKSNKRIQKKLPKGTEAASILLGQLDFVRRPLLALFRLARPTLLADMCEIATKTRFVFLVLCPTESNAIWEYSEVGRAMAVLLGDTVFCEVAYLAQSRDQLLDGIDEFVDDLTVLPPSIWDPSTRMEPPQQPITIEKLRERLQPENRWAKEPRGCQKHEGDEGDSEGLRRTGRFFGGLVADIRRRWRWYRSDFVDGLHTQCIASTIFLYFACITPIVTFGGLMGQKTGGLMGTMETLLSGAICGVGWALFSGQPLVIVGATGPLLVFEAIIYQLCTSYNVDFLSLRLWVGVWVAVCLLLIVAFDLSFLVQYITRFTEESFAVLISVIFVYEAFAKIADIWFTHPVQLGHADLGGGGLCLCARPSHNQLTLNDTLFNVTELTDVNGTLRVQDQMYQWHDGHDHYHHADYERAFGLSAGDILNSSLGKLAEDCLTSNNKVYVGEGCLTADGCVSRSWLLEGPGCESDYSADVFLLSVVLFIGTFALAMFCRQFRSTGYFPAIVRNMVGDFAVLLSVVVWSAIDFAFHINTPKLNVPPEFKPTNAERGWLINPLALTNWWLGLIAIFPALLATILIFLDQQITAVIVNRSEHKLKKGFGYHLDLLTLAVLITICSVLGLPWFVAATVRSITHVHSLIRLSDVQAPGERPQMLGVREQRVTGFFIHLLIGLSTLLTVVLRFIPMPVLYGVFLYMGITSLAGVQFIQRILIVFMPSKYQPDYVYLRHVRTFRVHIFTVVQVVCSALMWIIKSVKVTSIAFPLMLVGLIGVRKLFDYFYTQQELYWLDHLLPEDDRRKAEDERKSILQEVSIIAPTNGDARRTSVVLFNASGFKTEVNISIPSKRHSVT